jgi:diguanylate cyclase (GGDEF)-like protein
MSDRPKSLVSRIIFSTFVIYAAVTLSLLLIARFLVNSQLYRLENQLILQDRERLRTALDEEFRALSGLCREFGAWDLIWDFLDHPTPEFVTYNLSEEWRKQVDIDFIAFLRKDGSVAWGSLLAEGKALNTVMGDRGWTPELRRIVDRIRKDNLAQGQPESRNYLMPTARGPMYLVRCPILHSDYSGKPKGSVIFGKVLTPLRVETLARNIQTNLIMSEISGTAMAHYQGDAGKRIERTENAVSVPFALRYLEDDFGILFRVSENRRIWKQGQNTIRFLAVTITVGGLAIAICLLLLIRIMVLGPIHAIALHMRRFVEHEDYSSILEMSRRDELGQLTSDYGSLIRQIKDRSDQLHQANQELERIAHTDRLTGLANRLMFEEQSVKEIRRLRREKKGSPNKGYLGLIMCDIDFFKQFNDTNGHMAGDACLSAIGVTLQSSMRRAGDLACRFGGEEFIILLPDCDLAGAMQVAEMVRVNIEEIGIPHTSSAISSVVTISLGVTAALVNGDFSLKALMEEADRALYTAKRSGRNRVVAAST